MSGFQKVLVLDSAMNGCNVAYYDAAEGVCHADSFEGARGQAETLVPMVQDVLEQGAASFADVEAIVVVNGPGTFTGIRIGLSAARAFGFALGVPVYGVTSLQALALCYQGDANFTAVVETRRADFYVQGFDASGAALDEARSVLAEDVEATVVIGDAAARLCEAVDGVELTGGYERINPCVLGAAFCDDARRAACFVESPGPIYLRAPDVSHPKNPPRRIA